MDMTHIIKRDGQVVPFQRQKITDALFKAAVSLGGRDRQRAEFLTDRLMTLIPAGTPSVEEIQDLAERILMENGHTKTAKTFILYRAERQRIRSRREEKIVVDDMVPYKVLWKLFTWNVDHDCHTIEGLNRHLKNGTWAPLIDAAEQAYHSEIQKVSDLILKRLPEVRLVIVAGPSSSGKTTTTTKIGECLKERGVRFVLLNLDHYFRDIEEHPVDDYGDRDFEEPRALDLDLINEHLKELLKGRSVKMPFYNFKTGRREWRGQEIRLAPDEILLIDSLHGLYEPMTQSVPQEKKFRFYIEALCQLKDAAGEFVRWTDLRMVRRMVRDEWHRSYNPVQTAGHWHYVRRSEMRHIVPFIHSADYIFNGSLPYELPYHKKHLARHLRSLATAFRDDPQKLDAHLRAERVNRLFESLATPEDESAVPPHSLLREFIGGSVYSY
jgi:uridine kinase